jgi:hypothetical protein
MSNPSNLYAEKIYSEHPIALWDLDDKADYIALISESKRDFSNWSITGGSAVTSVVSNEPFPESQTSKITGSIPESDFGQIVCISENIVNFSLLSENLSTFSIGVFLNSLSVYSSSFEIGFEYADTTSGTIVQKLKRYNKTLDNSWFFISETFDVPTENTEFRVVLKINSVSGGESVEDYEFLVNGLTVGQWSEEFNSSSLGVEKVNIPSSIDVDLDFGIEANAYGLQDKKGYYVVEDNSLMAKNTGIPLVYGASGLTKLLPNNNKPSLIVPAIGFLGKDGQNKNYTLECWIRINSDSVTKKRIIGPISSTDGLYVEGPFLILKIGENYGSYYVGEWTRPMLVHIRVSENYASLLVNGEEVVALNYLTSSLSFPERINNLGKDQDWIGFYAYEDVSPIEIDCIAIYTYQVPIVLAKKRFVYGQGVEFPEGINQSYSGSSIFIDYPFADYTNNYSYPNLGNWDQAIIDNLNVENGRLSTPKYELPEIILSSGSVSDIYSHLESIQDDTDMFFSFSSVDQGCMVFNNLNFLKEKVHSIYGSFKFLQEPQEKEILFRIESQNSSDYFEISTNGITVDYRVSFLDYPLTTMTFPGVGEMFSVGIDIEKTSSYFGGRVASFFGNLNTLKLYIGGRPNLTETFQGNIYKIGLCTSKNHLKINEFFSERGFPVGFQNFFEIFLNTPEVEYQSSDSYFGNNPSEFQEIIDGGQEFNNFVSDPDILEDFIVGNPQSLYSSEDFQLHTASYTLSPSNYFDVYSLDIDVNGYWEDYIPLTYFSQYVKDKKNNSYYDIDFIQFNIDYPAPSKLIEEEQTGSWTYKELKDDYNIPINRTYQSLDNQLFTGYLNYDDLKNKASKNYKYDTSDSLIKSYITFQYIENGANLPDSNFANIQKPPNNSIISPGDEWINTKYEVVNNMIIYPPNNVRVLDLAIVTSLEFNVRGTLKNKADLRSLEYASQAFNSTSPNPIGTRFGNEIYPYAKSGFYYSYKDKNPFTIYKGSSPYLYLTRYTGIEPKGSYDPLVDRGLSIPINKEKAEDFKVIAMQLALRYDQDFFPYATTEIFEVESKNNHIKFYMTPIHPTGQRAKIYAVNVKTGQLENGIAYYWNGKIVKDPVLTVKEWGFLGLSFPKILDFENKVGSINLKGPLNFDTISYYKSTNLQEVQKVETRPWFNVKYSLPFTFEWDYWKSSSFLWNGVLILASTSYYGVDPSTIYKSYTGTNKIIVDTDKVFTLNGYEYSVYSNISVAQSTIDAV